MKIIFFFTNKKKLKNVGIISSKIPEISCNTYKFQNNNKIVLIDDEIGLTDFSKIFNDIIENCSTFSYVYHKKPDDEIKLFLNEHKNYFSNKEGMHEKGVKKSKIYLSIKDMVEAGFYTDLDSSLFDKIWEKFEKTNKKDEALDLLHNILNGEIINKDTLSKELKPQFETHYNINEVYSDEHEFQLVALRDAILKEKLANQN